MAELAAALASPARPARRFTYIGKIAAGALLVALADQFFFLADGAGATLAVFALVLLGGLLLALKPLRRSRPARLAAGLSLVFIAALADDPSPLALVLLWLAVSLLVLLPRADGFDDAWRWGLRLGVHAARALPAPFGDSRRLYAARGRSRGLAVTRKLPNLWLPLIGTGLFLALFAAANPIVEDAFTRIDLIGFLAGLSFVRFGFWLLIAALLWPLFRPRLVALGPARQRDPDRLPPGVSAGSIAFALVAFNAVFALENGLDLLYLWSGARLPAGMTFAGYAHRGAYPLIATALLAGLFVLATLRPGSVLAGQVRIRRLVTIWIAQNVLLVASTMLRTLYYVDAYALTRLRIAALIWMMLVAAGLVLICWRIARGRSGAWLINANAAIGLIALAACAFVDLGTVSAAWNVRHAREVGGPGVALDLCYLNRLDASALLPLIDLESGRLNPVLRDRVTWTRNLVMDRLAQRQSDWRAWTWRGARRLAEARALVVSRHLPRFTAGRRLCDGTLQPPPRPLTGRPQ